MYFVFLAIFKQSAMSGQRDNTLHVLDAALSKFFFEFRYFPIWKQSRTKFPTIEYLIIKKETN